MKKRRKICAVVRHAFQMVGRTWKSYALLSVTIVLSFSLLLGYLTFSDSEIYNKNKVLFSYRRQDICLRIKVKEAEKVKLMVDYLSTLEDTGYYLTYCYDLGKISNRYSLEAVGDSAIDRQILTSVTAYMLPDHSWPEQVTGYQSYTGNRMDIVWLDGQEHNDFTLEADQVIVTEALYQMMQMDQQEEPTFQLNLLYGQKIPLRVAGYTRDFTSEMWETYGKLHPDIADRGLFTFYLSNKFIDYAQINNEEYYGDTLGHHDPRLNNVYMHIYTESPDAVLSFIESMSGKDYTATYELQNAALDEIRPQKQVKAIITCALLLLLGINLYSSFTNAMNDRKYEIGVKRAVGASAFSIVRQFLYESVIVMAANILVSIALVADVAIVYKYIVEHTPDEFGVYPDYILYISPYSAAMFSICAVSLTVVFSLIFAYKSTRVEIVQYLKAE